MSDITVAINEATLQQALAAFVEVFQFSGDKSTSGNPRFGLHFLAHLRHGNLSLEPPSPNHPIYKDGFLKLTDLVVVWDELRFSATVHIPRVGWDSFCLIPAPPPFSGCLVKIPGASFFDCDVGPVTLPIDNIVRSRIDMGLAPKTHRAWNAERNTHEWRVVPEIVWSNVQPIDIAETIGDLIDELVRLIVDEALTKLPDWARDIVDAILGGIAKFIRALLSLPADLQSWLANLLRVSLDPFNLIFQLLVNHFQDDLSLYSVDDPFAVLPRQDGPPTLPAVLMPISGLDASIEPSEIVIEATS